MPSRGLGEAKQVSCCCFVLDCDMKVAARDADVRMPRSVPDFGQRSTAGERVANKRVPAVMDRQ
jgi:hypothetical protein